MIPASSYVYTDLSSEDALVLVINDVTYPVTQFGSTWAMNEIPTATCMLAVGRQAGTGLPAPVHTSNQLLQMLPAKVWLAPDYQFAPGKNWPPGPRCIFDGYFNGFSYRKVGGKVQAVAGLTHWLAAMTFSSCVTAAGHVSNPVFLNSGAVIATVNDSNAGQGNYITRLAPHQLARATAAQDLWGAVKNVFLDLAGRKTLITAPGNLCGGTTTAVANDAALAALRRIEPVLPVDGKPPPQYQWGTALALDSLGMTEVENAIVDSLANAVVDTYAAYTFWDKLIADFCALYGLGVVPMVDSAVVVADTPLLGGTFWRQLNPDEQDSFDMNADLDRPLRGVGVLATYDSWTGAGQGQGGTPSVGGCHVEQSVRPGDGAMLYAQPPVWLKNIAYQPGLSGAQAPTAYVVPAVSSNTLAQLYERYAHTVYATQCLRGRSGSVSGKLRFDIAPGSILRINPAPEFFLGGEDRLAFPLYGCVQRVTIAINAEASLAGTTFALSHLRTEAENGQPRTSVPVNPLFGKAIHGGGKHGCPLIGDWAFA